MLVLLLLFACDDTVVTDGAQCTLGKPTLSASSAAPGDQVVLTATPLTEAWDTAITLGSVRAQIVSLDRTECTECDDCRDTGGCAPCDACTDCATSCGVCAETVTFVVPVLDPGDYVLEMVNRNGRSEQISLTVTAPPVP